MFSTLISVSLACPLGYQPSPPDCWSSNNEAGSFISIGVLYFFANRKDHYEEGTSNMLDAVPFGFSNPKEGIAKSSWDVARSCYIYSPGI